MTSLTPVRTTEEFAVTPTLTVNVEPDPLDEATEAHRTVAVEVREARRITWHDAQNTPLVYWEVWGDELKRNGQRRYGTAGRLPLQPTDQRAVWRKLGLPAGSDFASVTTPKSSS